MLEEERGHKKNSRE
uniref:Uncharacterized protein n=1 Tax=Anguilla anguilla TaxID=7936 RepID=A0A0E9SBW3_ANGAN